MKKVLCAIAVLLLLGLGGTAFAQGNAPMLNCGTQELGLSGNVDFDDHNGDVELDIFASYGYFVLDNFELGGRASYSRAEDGDVEAVNLGIFAEYNFPVSNIVVPFIGVGVDYAYVDIYDRDEEAVVLTPATGLKFFITEYFAIDTRVYFNWSSEDMYVNDNRVEDYDWGMSLGLRTYF